MAEEHTHKSIKAEILGLTIDDTNKETIAEAFGMEQTTFIELAMAFDRYHKFSVARFRIDEKQPQPTKISEFADFLTSDIFKRLNIPMKTPNDYLLLGFAWSSSIVANEMIGKMQNGGLSGALAAFLKEHKHVHEEE